MTTGEYNAIYGFGAGQHISTGKYNTLLGATQGSGVSTGNRNTLIGFGGGLGLGAGDSANVFLGYFAGNQETGSDKLYIDNTNTTTPLIYGNFITDDLVFNGDVDVVGTLSQDPGTIADNDATPDVSGANIFTYQGSANAITITDLDNPVAGAIYYIIGNSDTYTVTINDGAPFALAGNVTLGIKDVLTLYCIADNNYVEITRSNN